MRLRDIAIVIIGLIVYIVLSSSADAGGGVGAASSSRGHALSGKIMQLKLDAAKAESEALAAKEAVLRQAMIEVRMIAIVAKITGMVIKTFVGMPISDYDMLTLSKDLAEQAIDLGWVE